MGAVLHVAAYYIEQHTELGSVATSLAAGLPLLVVLAMVPWVTVVGYETHGHRHHEQVLARL